MQVKRSKKTIILFVLLAILTVASLVVAGFFAKNYYELRANPNQASSEETERLTKAVSKLYQLPTDEEPIIGKVKDKEKLKDQPFFKNAANGDDILIYQKSKIAIIYREKEDKLINVGPIALDVAEEVKKETDATTPETDNQESTNP